MSRLRLKFIDSYVDRTGRRRFYFRRTRSAPRVPLPGLPGSAEFMQAYQDALEGEQTRVRKERGDPGTFDRLLADYLASPDYLRLAPSTRHAYKLAFERYIKDERIGHRRAAQMNREHITKMMARRAATPGAANDLLKKLKILIAFAIANGWRKDDPTLKIKKFPSGAGHRSWSDAEIDRYERHWPIGSKERLAFALFLFSGQRRSDVARMSWRDIEGDSIWVTQEKTEVKLLIPLHLTLRSQLAGWPKDHMMILTSTRGRPFSAASFGNWMAKSIAAAGLSDECTPHGLRRASARRLAEAGCSAHEIMAVTGHRTLAEVQRYTKEVEQKRLAQKAIKRLGDGSGTRTP